jgi:hypothetical protein
MKTINSVNFNSLPTLLAQLKAVGMMIYHHMISFISCDDMNKLHVGTLAVSRYHQLNRFFPSEDKPDYKDNDFPYRNSKIIPSGYMVLQHKDTQQTFRQRARSASPPIQERYGKQRSQSCPPRQVHESGSKYEVDKLHRLHFKVPRTGPLTVFNRASPFHSITSVCHASDLSSLLQPLKQQGKFVVSLVVDGGFLINFVSYERLWLDEDLDALIVTSHAPGQSAFNCIEHAWSPLSRWLAGVTFPVNLPDETPPCQQHLAGNEQRAKEALVFDAAIECLNGY